MSRPAPRLPRSTRWISAAMRPSCEDSMLIAQISDTHIRPRGVLAMGRVDTAGHLARAVAHINALRPAPDLVLVTGDLVDAGMAEEYAHLRDLLAQLVI